MVMKVTICYNLGWRLLSVSIEVNTLGFDPGEGGAVPSRTTIQVYPLALIRRRNGNWLHRGSSPLTWTKTFCHGDETGKHRGLLFLWMIVTRSLKELGRIFGNEYVVSWKFSESPYSNICDNAERNRENETCRDYNQPPKFKMNMVKA